jgi:hypothetical protein
MVNDRLYFFGGEVDRRIIGVLNGCNIDTVNVMLNFDVYFYSTALSVENGTKSRILSFYVNVNVEL